MKTRHLVVVSLWAAVFAVAIFASILCLVQGGFGGGHGRYDRLLTILGLPWNLFPWPDSVVNQPLIWLVFVPGLFNTLVAGIITYLLRSRAVDAVVQ